MSLTEGQLFTIEALNKIDGFVWPEDARFACAFNIVNGRNFGVEFYIEKPTPSDAIEAFKGALSKGDPTKVILGQHPDWRDSLITREQFDSVDGWVNLNGQATGSMEALIDVMLDGGLIVSGVTYSDALLCHQPFSKWRYSRPTKESEIKQEHQDALITDLLEQYTKKRNERERLQTEIECLQTDQDRIKDDENKLIEQIKNLLLQYGLEIRVIDEKNEKPEPELVITDWRDLQIGDVVECITPLGGIIRSGDRGVIKRIDGTMVSVDFKTQFDYLFPVRTLGVRFKFVRRPIN